MTGRPQGFSADIIRSDVTGMPVVHLGTVITTDHARELKDDQ